MVKNLLIKFNEINENGDYFTKDTIIEEKEIDLIKDGIKIGRVKLEKRKNGLYYENIKDE